MIAVIADDFTGAAEIAGLAWRHGLRADLLARSEPPSDADLVVYDADSRNCSPAEARRRLASILKKLHSRVPPTKPDPRSSRREEAPLSKSEIRPAAPQQGEGGNPQSEMAKPCFAPAWLYKKVDSVMRGNVIAEIESALIALRLNRCLLVPANPNAGRIIRRGCYYIRGTPLHRTDFRNDPRHPRLSAKVIDLLGGPQKLPLTVLRAGVGQLRDGINVGEVETFEDVQHWAALADAETLAVGGAEFFQALLRKYGLRSQNLTTCRQVLHCASPLALSRPPKRQRAGAVQDAVASAIPLARAARRGLRTLSPGNLQTLFVCGSLTESSRRFLAERRAKGWPVLLMPDELLAGGRNIKAAQTAWARQIVQVLRRHPNVVVGIGRPKLSGKQTPPRLGTMLTDTVKCVLSTAPPSRLCVEGGATAALLLERMGWRRMSVEIEYATGVTGARPHRCPELLLVCKPGSYAWPEALLA